MTVPQLTLRSRIESSPTIGGPSPAGSIWTANLYSDARSAKQDPPPAVRESRSDSSPAVRAPRGHVSRSFAITVVSGLPRSGTSMMMQMLDAAGLPPLQDDERPADRSNPNGYFELAAVKGIRRDESFLRHAVGRSIKIVSPLLSALPRQYDYRIIFMDRALDEILASQRAMLLRSDSAAASQDERALRAAYDHHLAETKTWLAAQPNLAVCHVAHRMAIENPQAVALAVDGFLFPGDEGERHTKRVAAMSRVVDTALHHHRS